MIICFNLYLEKKKKCLIVLLYKYKLRISISKINVFVFLMFMFNFMFICVVVIKSISECLLFCFFLLRRCGIENKVVVYFVYVCVFMFVLNCVVCIFFIIMIVFKL